MAELSHVWPGESCSVRISLEIWWAILIADAITRIGTIHVIGARELHKSGQLKIWLEGEFTKVFAALHGLGSL
jgi:hypothetical protein